MSKRSRSSPPAVREPMQVYLAPDDSDLLARLAAESGVSKAEVLRRGVRSYAREQGSVSPMLRFLAEGSADGGAGGWPHGVAADHDAVLAEAYRAPRASRASRTKRS